MIEAIFNNTVICPIELTNIILKKFNDVTCHWINLNREVYFLCITKSFEGELSESEKKAINQIIEPFALE
jgi:hypothetical protein